MQWDLLTFDSFLGPPRKSRFCSPWNTNEIRTRDSKQVRHNENGMKWMESLSTNSERLNELQADLEQMRLTDRRSLFLEWMNESDLLKGTAIHSLLSVILFVSCFLKNQNYSHRERWVDKRGWGIITRRADLETKRQGEVHEECSGDASPGDSYLLGLNHEPGSLFTFLEIHWKKTMRKIEIPFSCSFLWLFYCRE